MKLSEWEKLDWKEILKRFEFEHDRWSYVTALRGQDIQDKIGNDFLKSIFTGFIRARNPAVSINDFKDTLTVCSAEEIVDALFKQEVIPHWKCHMIDALVSIKYNFSGEVSWIADLLKTLLCAISHHERQEAIKIINELKEIVKKSKEETK